MVVRKKDRFEVFKRDKFTCQYCGRSAPDIVLHADHITPVSVGGTDDLLNLITSCRDCNLGKSNRLLSDDSAVKLRKQQLDDLQERREQLEMMLEWQRSLIDLDQQAVEDLAAIWDDLVPGYHFNENGLRSLGKHIKRFGVKEVIEAMRIATSQYLIFDGDKPTAESVERASNSIPGICYNRRRQEDKPYLKDLYYARGILRKRLHYVNESWVMKLMEDAVQVGWHVDDIQQWARETPNWSSFKETMLEWAKCPPEDN